MRARQRVVRTSLFWSMSVALVLVCLAPPGAAAESQAASSPHLPAAASVEGNLLARPPIVAIEAPAGPTEQAVAFNRTLQRDLELTGLFQLLDAPAAPQPQCATVGDTQVRSPGADWVLRARLTLTGAALISEVWLVDCVHGREVMHLADSAWADDGSLLAHRWVNKVLEYLTGQKGVFLTRLAFVRQVGTRKEIWVSDLDGGHAESLTPGADLDLMPSWSRNGRQVVFTSYRNGNPMLYVVDVRSQVVKALPAHGQLQSSAVFSPDGKEIAFTMSLLGNSDIYVMNADGSSLRPVTFGKEIDTSPTWSPDGKQIAFVSSRAGSPQIFVMNADGSNVQRLTMVGHYNQTPSWSPRGDVIAFTGRDEHGVFDIYAINVQTKAIARLTQHAGMNEGPSWSPDGQFLVFTRTQNSHRQLWMMKADGSHQLPVPLEGETSSPAWGPLESAIAAGSNL